VPPKIADGGVIVHAIYGISFHGRTDEDADSQAEYRLATAYGAGAADSVG
jgi:hypothetical protein